MIRKLIFTLFILGLLWVIGLFAGLPVIPWIDTNYYERKSGQKLSQGIILNQSGGDIKLEVPNYYNESDQCFDTWFTSNNIKIKYFSLLAFDKNNIEIPKVKIHLFGYNESREINDFTILNNDTAIQHNFKFIRTVYNVKKFTSISLKLKIDYLINNESKSYADTLILRKVHNLTWTRFKVH